MSVISERNARLDALEAALKEYASARRKQLHKQADRCKAILNGRSGSGSLAQASVQASTTLATTNIEKFLSGE